MNMLARVIIVGILSTLLLMTAGIQQVFAQSSLSDGQLQLISANCQSAKNTLNQLHASDALLRVNRGQLYESINTKLMDRFNSRVSGNGKDTAGLMVVTTSYSNTLNTFRTDYQTYERQLSEAIKIDCDVKPAEFHNAVEAARASRTKVHQGVLRLHQYIDDYRAAIDDLVLNDRSLQGSE